MSTKKLLMAVGAAALVLGSTVLVAAYPDRPIKLVVPFAAGGDSDSIARIFAERMAVKLGQSIIIENRTGGDTRIATEFVARAPADGYTMMMTSLNFAAVNKALYPSLPYDQKVDFAPVVQLASSPAVFVVSTKLGVGSLKEFLELARRQPGKLNYGTSSSTGLIFDKDFQAIGGFHSVQVPYRGLASAMQALVAGDIDYVWAPPATVLPLLATNRILPLATTARERMKSFAGVPTIFELGMPELAELPRESWWGIVAPAKTPRTIIAQWNEAANEAMKSPEVLQRLALLEVQPAGGTPEEFGSMIGRQIEKLEAIIHKFNIEAN
jgi:tripartite-type tricarboxylate transporter receptor subunit TctC